jgi:hypothetical protein
MGGYRLFGNPLSGAATLVTPASARCRRRTRGGTTASAGSANRETPAELSARDVPDRDAWPFGHCGRPVAVGAGQPPPGAGYDWSRATTVSGSNRMSR